jgi:hypothetical protein
LIRVGYLLCSRTSVAVITTGLILSIVFLFYISDCKHHFNNKYTIQKINF